MVQCKSWLLFLGAGASVAAPTRLPLFLPLAEGVLRGMDIAANRGWVNVGIDHDTAQFAVNSIRGWWQHLDHKSYPNAKLLCSSWSRRSG